jgi:hypothetical protein
MLLGLSLGAKCTFTPGSMLDKIEALPLPLLFESRIPFDHLPGC